MAEAARELTVRLRAEINGYQQAMRQAAASTAEFGRSVAGHGTASRQQIEQIGRASAVMSVGLAGGFALSAKAAMDWESSWAGVTKTVDGTASQMSALEAGLRDMATELPASATEIAGVAAAAGQLGVAAGDIESFVETTVALGETTNLSAEQAATAIARFSNIMGTSTSEVDRFGSTLVDLGNNSATTEAEILELGTRLAAAGAIAGLSEADVLAFASTLTSVGVEAEAGGTALSKVFTSVRDAVIDGGDKLATFAQVAGTTTSEFSQAFRDDAAGAIATFVEGLGELNDSGASTTAIFEELELTDQRLMRALLSTAGAGQLLTDQLGLANQAWEDNTALQTEAQQRYETTAAQMEILRNQVVEMAIGFGEMLLPAINGTVGVLGNLLDGFSQMPDAMQVGIAGVGGLAVALTGVVGVVGVVGPRLKDLQDSLKAMDGIGSTLGNNMGKVGAALGVLGVAAVGASLAWEAATRSSREYSDAVAEISAEIANVIDGQQRLNDVIGNQVSTWAEALGDDVVEGLNEVGIKFADIEDAIAGGEDALKPLRDLVRETGIDLDGWDVGELDDIAMTAPVEALGDELGLTYEQTKALIEGLEDLDNISQDAARSQLVLFGAATDAKQAIVDEAIAANTAADGTINYAGAAADVGLESRNAAGGVDALSDELNSQVAPAQSAADAIEDVIASYRGGFDAVFAYMDAQEAVEQGNRDAADAQQAITDAQRDAVSAAEAIEEAQMGVARAMMETFNAADAAAKGVDDYINSQRASIDPVFAMIDALKQQEELLNREQKIKRDKDGHKLTATGKGPATPLEIAQGNLAVDQAAARLAGAISTGAVSVDDVRQTLDTWVRQGRLSADQAADLGEKMEEAAAQADMLQGANVRGAIASTVAAEEAKFLAEKAEAVAEAQGKVQDATQRAEEANRRVADAMADASERASTAAGRLLDMEAASLRLQAALDDNPALLQEMIETVDRWVDRGFFSESQGEAFKRRLIDSVNGAVWQANQLDLQLEVELVARGSGGWRIPLPEGGFRTPGGNVAMAEGGIMEFANGGITQAHIANMQQVKYAEPQTGGEAYVPRYGDLSRSTAILQQAAGWYGMQLSSGAGGGGAAPVDNSMHVQVLGSVTDLGDLYRELQSVQHRRSSLVDAQHGTGLG